MSRRTSVYPQLTVRPNDLRTNASGAQSPERGHD